MNKKSLLIWIFAWLCYSASCVFANNTALTELESWIKTMLTNDKAKLMSQVDTKVSTSNKLYSNTLDIIIKQKEYKILIWNSLLSWFTKDSIDEKWTEFKWIILTNYSNLSSEYSLLQEKLSLKLINQTIYEQWLASIKSKLNVAIDNLTNTINSDFANLDSYIVTYWNNYDLLKKSQSTLIESVLKKESNLLSLMDLITQYLYKVDNINKLFTIKNDDIHLFQSELKSIILTATQDKFVALANQYYEKNSNLNYNRTSINQFIQTILDSVNVQIDNQFDALVWDLYSKQDEDYFKLVKSELTKDYYSGSDLIYENLNKSWLSLDKHYTDAYIRLWLALSWIDSKMKNLNNSYDISDLKTVLTDKFKEFADKQYVEKYDEVKNYLDDQSSLIDLQLKQDEENYNKLVETSNSVMDMLWKTPKKLENLVTLYNNIEKTKGTYLKQEHKDALDKLQWKVEYERISVLIAVEWLIQYIRSYPSIEVRLDKILTALYEDAKSQWKEDVLKEKLIKTIWKVDTFIVDKWIEWKSKYVVLEIKKAIIKFIYLD